MLTDFLEKLKWSLGQENWNLAERVRGCAKLRRSCTQQQQQRRFRHNRRQTAVKVPAPGCKSCFFWVCFFGTGRNLSIHFSFSPWRGCTWEGAACSGGGGRGYWIKAWDSGSAVIDLALSPQLNPELCNCWEKSRPGFSNVQCFQALTEKCQSDMFPSISWMNEDESFSRKPVWFLGVCTLAAGSNHSDNCHRWYCHTGTVSECVNL